MIKKLLFSMVVTIQLGGLAQATEPGGVPGALSAKAVAVFCADPGHEDGVPPAQAVEMRNAIERYAAQGKTALQAIEQLKATHCGGPAAAPKRAGSSVATSNATMAAAARAARLDADPDVNGMPSTVSYLTSETTLRNAAAAAQRDSDPRLNGTAARASQEWRSETAQAISRRPIESHQLLLSANENKVELLHGTVTVRRTDTQDSLAVFDISASPARMLAKVNLPVSVVGPPQTIALTPDLSVALVTAATRINPEDAKLTDGDQISVVDLEATPPALVQSMTVGRAPAGIAVSPDGKLVLAVTRADSTVLVFALEGKRLRQTAMIALPEKSVPGGVAFTPDGKRALVTRDGDSTVTVLSIEAGEVKLAGRDLYTGVRPYGVQVSPSGEWAVVGNVGRGQGDHDTIALVDMRGPLPRAVHHATVGPTVEGVAISPDSKLVAAVVHDGSNRAPSSPLHNANGRVAVFRIDDGKLMLIGSAPIGKWSQGAAFSADSRRLFVQNMVERNIQVFRVAGNAVVDTGERISLPGGGAAMAVGHR